MFRVDFMVKVKSTSSFYYILCQNFPEFVVYMGTWRLYKIPHFL